MTYNKAEIRVLGEAAAVIQDFTKDPIVFGQDSLNPQDPHRLNPAYDLDE